MDKRGKELRQRLLAAFKGEAQEHVQTLSSGLVALESMSDPSEWAPVVETVFREAHSLKGAARAIDHAQIESICQAMESVFAELKHGHLRPSSSLCDVLNEAVDFIASLLPGIGGDADGRSHAALPAGLLERLDQALHDSTLLPSLSPSKSYANVPVPPPSAVVPGADEKPVPAPSNTVRVATAKLDAVLFQSEELLSAKLAAAQLSADIRQLLDELDVLKQERTRVAPSKRFLQLSWEREAQRSGFDKSDPRWRKFLEFLAWESVFIKAFEIRVEALSKSAEHGQRALVAMVDGLLEDMKHVLMLPVSTALGAFPKLVRDLARDQGKDVELIVQGEELEIDRRILDELRDPLVHLARNCIDHGIEAPQVRIGAGKPARGTLTFAIAAVDGKVEFVVADDGAGIDATKVHDNARRLGLLTQDEIGEGSGAEHLEWIFRSGVSTSPIITDLSGRGLGLAIVREKVERLGGTVSAETQPGRGTRFRMVLPLTLATFRGVRVRINGRHFIVPTTHVEQGVSLSRDAIRTVENRETIPWQGRTLALVHLGDALGLPGAHRDDARNDTVHALVLGGGGKRIAFAVDEIVCEQEVLVKPLGRKATHVRNVAGAAVLGTGQLALILDVPDLLRSAVALVPSVRAPAAQEPVKERKSILVAEDSITSRALLKDILEAAGYRVDTAVDGIDGITQLKTGRFDLLVSDVEMPRMNGFDLTAKVRADRALARMPVVLVTALESREHRELGVEVGANAYVVKSSFDQSNLLDVIRRLI